MPSTVPGWWSRYGSTLLWIGAAAMILAALWRMSTGLPYLLWVAQDPPPTDLHARHGEVARWFAGVFRDVRAGAGDYPPASYVLLWPFLGWLSLDYARWLWGGTALVGLAALGYLAGREGGATSREQRLFLFLVPFASYAATATMSVGQLGNHVLPMLVGGLLLFHRSRGRWWEDAGAAGMVLFALVKPALSAPFFWIVCFAMGRWRPVALVVLGYAALTAFAASFHDEPLLVVLTAWQGETPYFFLGHANLHRGLAAAGLEAWVWPLTLATLLAFGGWVFRHRDRDLWVLMGVAALITRLLFHHRIYDDLLVFIPMITLFRIASAGARSRRLTLGAGVLFTLAWATLQMPIQLLGLAAPVPTLVEAGQAGVWITMLVFLLMTPKGPEPRPPPASL
jgi:hypothetical protein